MKYLLDTCVISELVKPSPDPLVLDWLHDIPSERLFISVITIGEIRKGLTKLPNSKGKDRLTEWLNTLLEDYQDRIYTIDLTVAENWGVMQSKAEKSGRPMSSMDSLIAAISYTHNSVLVTKNLSNFSTSNLPIHNPWKSD